MIAISFITYFSVFASSLFFSKICKKNIERSVAFRLLAIIVIIIPPVLLSTFRSGVGTDYYGYKEVFNSIKNSISFNNVLAFYQEPGWVLINLICNSYFSVLFISSLIYSLTITFAIFRLRDKIGITFPLFISYMVFYSLSFNGIRQAIAAAIFLLALSFIDKNRLKYILLIILAALFHKSAIICLALLLFYNQKKSNLSKLLVITTAFSVIVFIFSNQIISFLERLNLYSKYLESSDDSGSGSFGFLLYILPVTVLLLFIGKKYKINDNYFKFIFFVFLMQVPFQILGIAIPFADRIAEYGLISQIILVPYSLNRIENKQEKRNYFTLFTCWYIFYYVFMFVVLKSNGVYPYFLGA